MYQMTFSEIPLPKGFPWRLTVRKIRPAATFADDTALVDAFDRRSQPEKKTMVG